MTNFGFVKFPEDWSGPEFLEFSLFTEHSRVVRYVCSLQSSRFDLYAPKFLLDNLSPDKVPQKLLAVIGRAPVKKESIGFATALKPPRVEYDLCEYIFSQEKVNSFRYDINIDSNLYALYVPKEIFHGQPPPTCLYLRLAIPNEEV